MGSQSLNVWNCAGWIFPSLFLLNSAIHPSRPSWSPTSSSKFTHWPSFLWTAQSGMLQTVVSAQFDAGLYYFSTQMPNISRSDHTFCSHLPSSHLICRWPHWWHPLDTCWVCKQRLATKVQRAHAVCLTSWCLGLIPAIRMGYISQQVMLTFLLLPLPLLGACVPALG